MPASILAFTRFSVLVHSTSDRTRQTERSNTWKMAQIGTRNMGFLCQVPGKPKILATRTCAGLCHTKKLIKALYSNIFGLQVL